MDGWIIRYAPNSVAQRYFKHVTRPTIRHLKQACASRNAGLVRWMIQHGVPVTDSGINGRTPLYMATEAEDLEVVTILLDAGAISTDRPGFAFSPFHLAVYKGYDDLVQLFLARGALRSDDSPPLLTAVFEHRTEVIRMLMEHGVSVSPGYQNEVSSAVADVGSFEMCHIFETNGFSLDHLCSSNRSFLHVAVRSDNPDTVRYALKHHDRLHWRDNHGLTPLEENLVYRKSFEIFKMLVDADSALNGERTPTQNTYCELSIREYVTHGLGCAGLDVLDSAFANIVQLAVTFQSPEKVQYLIASGAKLDLRPTPAQYHFMFFFLSNRPTYDTEWDMFWRRVTARPCGHLDAWMVLATQILWLSDQTHASRTHHHEILERDDRKSMVLSRRIRDVLRPLVDPRAKHNQRRQRLFARSPLLRLPWHLRVDVLRYIVTRPIRPEWGKEEFETDNVMVDV